MKILALITCVLFINLNGIESRSASGISFFDGTVAQALERAKSEKKPIFVYVYASWCGQCKKLKKSFKDKAAAEYYNRNFINIAVNGETDEGAMLLEKYSVKVYPTLLILDAGGKQLTKTTGYHTPYLLMNFGKRIVAK